MKWYNPYTDLRDALIAGMGCLAYWLLAVIAAIIGLRLILEDERDAQEKKKAEEAEDTEQNGKEQ